MIRQGRENDKHNFHYFQTVRVNCTVNLLISCTLTVHCNAAQLTAIRKGVFTIWQLLYCTRRDLVL